MVILVATLVPVASATESAPGKIPADPDPVVGLVAGEAIRLSHADELRALLAPPPSREAAERLAVDVALVWWDRHGSFEGATAKARLAAWRAWLVEIERRAPPGRIGDEIVLRIAAIERRADDGNEGGSDHRK